ncbi:MAG: hypothetical protein WKG07_19950 [Hymenobacter sp.]
MASGKVLTVALQWSDPFYTTRGSRTDLDAYLLSSRGDTITASTSDNAQARCPSSHGLHQRYVNPHHPV